MRYAENSTPEILYSQSEGLHFMLAFTVSLGLLVGCVLLWLGMHGRIMWLRAWSVGLIVISAGYLVADVLRYV